jgi:intein/homing endonuclease
MEIKKDIYGNEIKVGDIIAFPHVKEGEYEDKILNGYYVTKVFYDKDRDRLVDDNGVGFRFAYGIVKLNR